MNSSVLSVLPPRDGGQGWGQVAPYYADITAPGDPPAGRTLYVGEKTVTTSMICSTRYWKESISFRVPICAAPLAGWIRRFGIYAPNWRLRASAKCWGGVAWPDTGLRLVNEAGHYPQGTRLNACSSCARNTASTPLSFAFGAEVGRGEDEWPGRYRRNRSYGS